MISPETISKIFDTARIEEVVGDVVSLKKRGVNLLGLCPFHDEKTPSFTVSPVKGIYKCFGCGKGGNAVNFVMDNQQMSYPEALRFLAKRYNIEIEDDERSDAEAEAQKSERESLFVVSAFAQKYFTEQMFNSDEGKSIGYSYFKERGLSDETIKKFQLGYSPESRNAFSNAAVAAGYSAEHLIKAGLCGGEPNNLYDRFAGRVMFPVHNVTGRVIAFGGRTLKTDKKISKYINSPETEIYHKSNVLYGMFFAKKSIMAEDNCFLVEGYTDVTSLFQAGVENAVASSGTSLTVEQIRQIRRYTSNITIMYDGDAAGIKASFRGIDLILEEGLNVKVLLFPDGDDPDSYSKKVSTEELKDFIKKNTKDFIAFKTGLLVSETANDPTKKAGLIKEIVESIALIPETITRSVYIRECSRIMDVSETALLQELNKIRRGKFNKNKQVEPHEVKDLMPDMEVPAEDFSHLLADDIAFQEKDLIRILLNYGEHTIEVDSLDENGKVIKITVPIKEYVHNELSVADTITFEYHSFHHIYQEFVKSVEEERKMEEKFFLNHEDEQVRSTAIELLSSPYTLSENWEKHGIMIEMEDQLLKRAVQNSVFSLKSKIIMRLLKENHEKIKVCSDENEIMNLLLERKELENFKIIIASQLGRVVLK